MRKFDWAILIALIVLSIFTFTKKPKYVFCETEEEIPNIWTYGKNEPDFKDLGKLFIVYNYNSYEEFIVIRYEGEYYWIRL